MAELSQQDILQQQLVERSRQAAESARRGGQAASRAFTETMRGATSFGEKAVFFGSLAGIAAFFLPWYDSGPGFFVIRGTGFTFARQWGLLYLEPFSLAVMLILAWFGLNASPERRILNARWPLAIGAAWTMVVLVVLGIVPSGVGYGGLLAAAASIAVLIGGFMQIGEQLDRTGKQCTHVSSRT